MNFNEKLEKYAQTIVKIGAGIQKGQGLVIRSSVESLDFVRILTKVAYENGASDVEIVWSDTVTARYSLEYKTKEKLSDFPEYESQKFKYYIDNNYAFISVIGADPNAYKGVDVEKIRTSQIAYSKGMKYFSDSIMSDKNSWCVVGAVTKKWAKSVFPDLSEEKACEKLWDLIFYTCRIEQNWEDHISNLQSKAKYLNELNIKELHYKTKRGTDLRVQIPKGYIFHAAGSINSKGDRFVANIPTEEVFTMPHKDGINGIVYSTKPLNNSGTLIEDFALTFKDGKVIDVVAKVGEEVLKSLISTDEGAKSLGEVALVPFKSPISDTNVLFNTTLYDENASCHFALGRAYPSCIENGTKLSQEELNKLGVNDSLIHVDFMVGDETLDIIATTHDGREIQIFKNGNWA